MHFSTAAQWVRRRVQLYAAAPQSAYGFVVDNVNVSVLL